MEGRVVLEINGKNYTGWNKASITRSMETFLGQFVLTLVESSTKNNPFGLIQKGDSCRIYVEATRGSISEIPILSGYVTDAEREKEGNSTSMVVSGVDETVDIVDCSAIVSSNSWTKATLPKIANDLVKPYGIYVDERTDTEKVYKNITVQNGESCFDVIERVSRSEAILPLSDRFGNLVLTYAADENSPSIQDLVDGENIIKLAESSSDRATYSEYIFRGQNSGDGKAWGKSTTRLQAKAIDKSVKRHRPLIVLSEGKTDQQKLQDRANWEAQVRAGRAKEYTAVLLDWFIDPPGTSSAQRPWVPNSIINLISEDWQINKKYLITSVTFELDPVAGATSTLILKDPKTYAKNPDGEIDI